MTNPEHRRNGYARTLMEEMEQVALSYDKSALILDTSSGEAAEMLYKSMNYSTTRTTAGSCCNPSKCSDGATTSMRKELVRMGQERVVSA
jgi:hypothetical protein